MTTDDPPTSLPKRHRILRGDLENTKVSHDPSRCGFQLLKMLAVSSIQIVFEN